MTIRILSGTLDDGTPGAAMVDGQITGHAFGPVFPDADAIRRFRGYVERMGVRDVRLLGREGLVDAARRFGAEEKGLPLPFAAAEDPRDARIRELEAEVRQLRGSVPVVHETRYAADGGAVTIENLGETGVPR